MRIFTERGFQEEINRRQEAMEEASYLRCRMNEIELQIERLHKIVDELIEKCRGKEE